MTVRMLFAFALAAITLLAVAITLRPVAPAHFEGRVAIPVSKTRSYFYRSARADETTAHAYYVNKSLIVRSPSVMNNPKLRFTFRCLLAKAFGVNCESASGLLETALYKQIDPGEPAFAELNRNWKTVDPNRSLKTLPLIQLAVVNRLDLAVVGCQPDLNCVQPLHPESPCQRGYLCGAEIRFVYAGVPQADVTLGHYFTLILEFTLPNLAKADFIALSKQWDGLAALRDDPNGFSEGLEHVLDYSLNLHGVKPRIRISGRQNSEWKLIQFIPEGADFVAQYLFQQPSNNIHVDTECQESGRDLAKFVAPHQGEILTSKYMFDKSLATAGISLTLGNTGVLTLGDDVLPKTRTETVRHILSLNSCSGCHGRETKATTSGGTPFDQIRFRSDFSKQSELAPFLTGDDSGEPSLKYSEIKPPLVLANSCRGESTPTYHYNDLLRRAQYLRAVLKLSDSASDEVWYEKLHNLSVTAID